MERMNFIGGTTKPDRRRLDFKWRWRNLKAIPTHRGRYLYEQHDFMQLLYFERRRSERSSRPFCLVLLGAINIADGVLREVALQRVFQLLRTAVRETDILGWYEQNTTLAIMFSDLKSADTEVLQSLQTKASDILAVALMPELLKYVQVSVHVFPHSNDLGMDTPDLTFYPDLAPQSQAQKTAHILKRIIDITGSFLLLCLLGPLFALIAFLIKLDSQGPVIFRQVRIGQQGKPFNFLKFRSMCVGSDAAIHKEYVSRFISQGQAASHTATVYKITDDPRVTKIGRVLRKTSLDELPQFWNVLCGQMSLVGPRPPLPYEIESYATWHRRRILEIKPGMTGLWQVTGRSRTTFNEMVRLDLRYVQQWSIWLDFKILLQTPKAVVMGEGAY